MPGPKKTTGSDARWPNGRSPRSPAPAPRRPRNRPPGATALPPPRRGGPAGAPAHRGGVPGAPRASAGDLPRTGRVGRPVAVWDRDLPAPGGPLGAARTIRSSDVAVGIDVRRLDSFSSAWRALWPRSTVSAPRARAGVDGAMPVTMLDEDSWDAVLDVNLRAAALLTRRSIPACRRRDGSAIVYISSIEGFFGHSYSRVRRLEGGLLA